MVGRAATCAYLDIGAEPVVTLPLMANPVQALFC